MLACGRYRETKEVFSDHIRFVSSRGVGIQDFKLEKPWRPPSLVLEVDPPEHTKNRRFLSRALSPNKISQLKDFFKDCANKLIQELVQKREIDGISDLAEIFPTRVFPEAEAKKKSIRKLCWGMGLWYSMRLALTTSFVKMQWLKDYPSMKK